MPLGSQDAHSLVSGAIDVMVNLNISAATAAASKDLLQRQLEQRIKITDLAEAEGVNK